VGRKRVGVLPGAFNPVTLAHLALVDASLGFVEETICVVPRVYPHKELHGAGLADRLEMLRKAGGRYHVELGEGGLFVNIARDLHQRRPDADFYFICGRDAAERVVNWDYGEHGSIERLLEEFHLLVAARQGEYHAPGHLRHRIHSLPLAEGYDEISSSEVRRRIAAREPWEHLVPESIVEMVRRIYQDA
jgi:nicotinate-nucleotide adenylyltransferase